MSTMAGEATRRREGTVRRVAAATETKHSSKTTEFYAMIGVIAAILIAAWYVGRNGGTDTLRASDAWLYISIVASAYMISRGLAKSGSHEPRTDDVDRR